MKIILKQNGEWFIKKKLKLGETLGDTFNRLSEGLAEVSQGYKVSRPSPRTLVIEGPEDFTEEAIADDVGSLITVSQSYFQPE